MSGLEIAGIGLIATFVGGLIGCVGIGGVLLVPSLYYLFAIPVHTGIAAAMVAYVFTGIVGTVIYARHGSVKWNMAFILFISAGPAAFGGAVAVSVAPGKWLELLIACLIVIAGINALRKSGDQSDEAIPQVATPKLLGMGALTGVGSAMTGTGGPLILVPMAVWMGFPALTAVGLSQAVQLPIAVLATAGNITYGTMNWTVAVILSAAMIVGSAIGAKIAHAVPRERLRLFLAWVLVGVGLFFVSRLIYGQFFT
ncbi:MAG: sulfite exporter TauE/SafE family protein [Rhodospirillaceae bacterium]